MQRHRLNRETRDQLASVKRQSPKARFYLVVLHWDVEDPEDSTGHIVSKGDLAKFVEAALELHFEPGINPHSNENAAPVQYITVDALQPTGPYWWSTPGLQGNDDRRGATVWQWLSTTLVWVRPGVELPPEEDG
jgi:hypothetical protein